MGTLIVEGKVTVELKSVEKVHPAHKKQFLTYLRLTGMKLRRRPDEGWHHANRLRRVMSPSPWLCGSVENQTKRTRRCTGAGDPGVFRWKVTCARLVTAVVTEPFRCQQGLQLLHLLGMSSGQIGRFAQVVVQVIQDDLDCGGWTVGSAKRASPPLGFPRTSFQGPCRIIRPSITSVSRMGRSCVSPLSSGRMFRLSSPASSGSDTPSTAASVAIQSVKQTS